MALTVAKVVGQFKANVEKALSAEHIRKGCQCLGVKFRNRVFDPVQTIHAFLVQILNGNVAITGLAHLVAFSFCPASYCAARMRLPLSLLEWLVEQAVEAFGDVIDGAERWRGHRTWMMDGSSFSMPDTPELQKHFGQPGGQRPGCGFPVAHLLALFHARTGILQKIIVGPMRTHDMKHAALMHPELRANDVLVADRGFCSYAHLALLLKQKMHGLFRCHQRQIVDFRDGRDYTKRNDGKKGLPSSRWRKSLGRRDQLVEYFKPALRPTWMNQEQYDDLPDSIVVREHRYLIDQKGRRTRSITLVTTLLDAAIYPATELAILYGQRWQVETNLRHLKTTMRMEVLRCQTAEGVKKEMYMFALIYNLVRVVMLEASARQKEAIDRISFIDVLRWLRTAKPGDPLPKFVKNPGRSGRYEPRAVKRRPKEYDRLNKPRAAMRKALENSRVAT